ncbi:hypothetical protein Agabi119p4_2537 [Agaricus bisporus var. burnettii]|uniref:Uncharacterized protein n=1 Tax=Agaricus bisporus var. burnettii TaxID=192524 RepID=A0A8H7F998_AGABI|nr:hypothetical protein Agabi119p4_2537 [Agaricus bisporus var. burnettii]
MWASYPNNTLRRLEPGGKWGFGRRNFLGIKVSSDMSNLRFLSKNVPVVSPDSQLTTEANIRGEFTLVSLPIFATLSGQTYLTLREYGNFDAIFMSATFPPAAAGVTTFVLLWITRRVSNALLRVSNYQSTGCIYGDMSTALGDSHLAAATKAVPHVLFRNVEELTRT